ncbi:MAG: hypothetical protein V4714_11980 [Bacteroidota bacterium]
MIDLFRYIEQSFVVPQANFKAIDVNDATDFQISLRKDLKINPNTPADIRKKAEDFIQNHPLDEGVLRKDQQLYHELYEELLSLTDTSFHQINETIQKIFHSSAKELASLDSFKNDKKFLNDLIVAVKISTGFDKVRANDIVALRQTIALIDSVAVKEYKITSLNELKSLLLRPILIPSAYLKSTPQPLPTVPGPEEESDEVKKREALKKEYEHLKAAYGTLMSLRPDELEMREINEAQKPINEIYTSQALESPNKKYITEAPKQVLAISNAAIRKLDLSVLNMFERESIDLRTTNHHELVKTINYKRRDLGYLIDPCGQVKAVTKVYRLGVNAFAINSNPTPIKSSATASPDFSHAITRPVGIGNLQVVRQELLGYEAKEVSHIENILEGEILRHSTMRSNITEVTITEETQTTQTDERDLQSTIRNEMVAESQKEAGQQSSSAKDQTTTASYGKLVENSKSNYAKTVTDRAVSSLSQQVKYQRIQRERKTFTEKSVHEFDNSKAGAKNVTGIYQWVDKKYRTRIMNYGTRLLYDVVVPEPAAFLIESLKNAPQPEGFELIKPDVFDMCPSCLDADNYACLAAKYGVTGSVVPPPDDFIQTVSKTESPVPKANETFTQPEYSYFTAFSIDIKEGYKAVSGYVQRINQAILGNDYGLEFFIGEHYYNHFASSAINTLNHSFGMKGETGQIPVTFRSYAHVYQFNFAIGINCQRTDKAYELWQLKTHAALMNGYNRQLAEYQDKLSKLQALIRSQMAQAANYAHNPSIEQGELKKAFIYLLLSEHFSQAYIPAPNPTLLPPDPTYIKNWGAMVAFFERAFEWENMMFTYYPYFWGRSARWGELILIQDISPQFEEFLKAGAARVVIPVRPGFEAALAHYQETGQVWMGEEIPDMFSSLYVSIIQEIKARNFTPEEEICVAEWDVNLPTTLVMLKEDATLPAWKPV